MNTKNTGYRGPGFATLLAILFIGLKLTGHITWSWWWVLAPLWLPITVVVVVLAVLWLIKCAMEHGGHQ